VKLIVASGKAIVDEGQLPAGARFFAKPYDRSKIVQAIIGLLPEANGKHALLCSFSCENKSHLLSALVIDMILFFILT
jgi:hypothetical protein